MVYLAALEAESWKIGYNGDGDMVVGGGIATEDIVHLTAADMYIDFDAALLIVQSLKARQFDDLVSRTKLFIKDAQQLYIPSNSSSVCVCLWSVCVCLWSVCVCLWSVCVCLWSVCVFVVYVCGVCMCVFGRVLVVNNASMIDLLLYEIGNEE